MALLLISGGMSLRAEDYFIYSITQDFPMGYENEVLKKNYYLNMGKKQGIETGSVLNVYRTIFEIDTYNNNRRNKFKVKIGQVKITHVEEQNAIARLLTVDNGEEAPQFDIPSVMIGDSLTVPTP